MDLPPPDHTLPLPHDMELPVPKDMQLSPHFTQRHSWIHWLPAIVGLFIGMVVGGVFIGDASKQQEEIKQEVAAKPQRETANTVSQTDIAVWKVYINEKYNFSIMYPPNLFPTKNTDTNIAFTKQIAVNINPSDPENCVALCPIFSKRENVFINGMAARMLEGTIGNAGEQSRNGLREYVIPINNTYYLLTYTIDPNGQEPDELSLFKQIASTFTYSPMNKNTSITPTLPESQIRGVVCTQDAKQCPDGSYVNRIGPRCEFAECRPMP
jgi:hypothetical protein